jgi:hypothetical protein
MYKLLSVSKVDKKIKSTIYSLCVLVRYLSSITSNCLKVKAKKTPWSFIFVEIIS